MDSYSQLGDPNPKMNSAGEHVVGQAPLHGGVSRPQASRGSSWRGNHPPLTYHKCLGFKPSPLRLWRWLYHLRFLLDFWDHVYSGLKLDQFRPGNPVEDPRGRSACRLHIAIFLLIPPVCLIAPPLWLVESPFLSGPHVGYNMLQCLLKNPQIWWWFQRSYIF